MRKENGRIKLDKIQFIHGYDLEREMIIAGYNIPQDLHIEDLFSEDADKLRYLDIAGILVDVESDVEVGFYVSSEDKKKYLFIKEIERFLKEKTDSYDTDGIFIFV